MAKDFYSMLSDKNLLKRAWHLSRQDSKGDFLFDPYRFADYAFKLDEHIEALSQSLESNSYHPKPLLTIDVPKSGLSVRPGTVLDIEDRIVLYAIICLIAPGLDKKLPSNVYSWRVKDPKGKKEIFRDSPILEFPFLKKATIQKRIQIIEPWYEVWPPFIEDLAYAYEKDGYKYLVLSDIVSYFENIDLELLKSLLRRHLPHQPRIINFLIEMLEYWAWPSFHGTSAPRGIPQGNAISSFLGNFYLLPLDEILVPLTKKRDLKYLRYVDDIKILAKDLESARKALFLINETLRSLRLNIQSKKTRILQDEAIKHELTDERITEVNNIIENISKSGKSISSSKRKEFIAQLKKILKKVRGKKGIIEDRDLRLFRRLITGFTAVHDRSLVKLVLDQIERNPDSRLFNSAVRYLREQDRNLKLIPNRLLTLIAKREQLFPYQEAHLFMTMRYMRNVPPGAWHESKSQLKLKKNHWYVRQQAVCLLGLKLLTKAELRTALTAFKNELNLEVRRTWAQALMQLPKEELQKVAHGLVLSAHPKLQRIGRFCHGLLSDESRGMEQIKSIFNEFSEDKLIDRIYVVEALSKSDHSSVKKALLETLKLNKKYVHRPLILTRVNELIKSLLPSSPSQISFLPAIVSPIQKAS